MLKVDFTNDRVFGFDGPNLCLLGNESDFRKLAESLLELMDGNKPGRIDIAKLDFAKIEGEEKRILFLSKNGANSLGIINSAGDLIFELDSRVWERLFPYFVLMSWDKKTYYLNEYENGLNDLGLEQECNFICSSEF